MIKKLNSMCQVLMLSSVATYIILAQGQNLVQKEKY